jgi:hypothetical protein
MLCIDARRMPDSFLIHGKGDPVFALASTSRAFLRVPAVGLPQVAVRTRCAEDLEGRRIAPGAQCRPQFRGPTHALRARDDPGQTGCELARDLRPDRPQVS